MTTDTTPVTEPDPSIDAIVDADGHMPHVPAEVREAIAQGHSALMAALTIIERRTHERDQYAAMVAKVTDPAYLEGALRAAGATATEAARLRERVAALEATLTAVRAEFNVETLNGHAFGISHASTALHTVVRLLDETLAAERGAS